MLLKTKPEVLLPHTAAVVNHLDERPPRILNDNLQLVGPGIDSVIQQLFHHRTGTLDNFSGSNFIGNFGRQWMYNGMLRIRFLGQGTRCVSGLALVLETAQGPLILAERL